MSLSKQVKAGRRGHYPLRWQEVKPSIECRYFWRIGSGMGKTLSEWALWQTCMTDMEPRIDSGR